MKTFNMNYKDKAQRINTFILISCTILLFSRQINAQTTDHANALNNYSFDLYHEVKNEKENFLLSPLSTYCTLLMSYEGSENKTKQEFEKVLYIINSDFTKNPISYLFERNQDNYTISNAIWFNKGAKIKEEYRNAVNQKYFSDFLQTDFNDQVSAVSDINSWVSQKTNRKINEIIDVSNIDSTTQLLISNAVYFKGEWLHKFDRQKTISDNFFTNSQEQYRAVFMNMTENIQYYENNIFQFISKPYKDAHLSFCIVLPKDIFGLEEVEKTFNTDSLQSILNNISSTRTLLYLPKFNMESSYELSTALKQIGLQTAFSNEADFSGITEGVPLNLELILHKTIIEFDEEKTEAAAATAQAIYITGTPTYKVFKADHPFMFFVIDNRSKAIVFMGRYMKPQGRKAIEKEHLTQNIETRRKESTSKGWTSQKLLYVVDKKIQKDFHLDSIDAENIESINIIKDKEQIRKYSQEDYDGAIVITTKKKKKKKSSSIIRSFPADN